MYSKEASAPSSILGMSKLFRRTIKRQEGGGYLCVLACPYSM
jgi:hypothetical protein